MMPERREQVRAHLRRVFTEHDIREMPIADVWRLILKPRSSPTPRSTSSAGKRTFVWSPESYWPTLYFGGGSPKWGSTIRSYEIGSST